MTPRPETTKGTAQTEVTPEKESPSRAEAEPTAKPMAEPQPEWNTAVDTWGVAWEFHQYGLGALFGVIGFLALVALVKIFKKERGARQKKVPFVVLSQIVLFGLSRCLFLCTDAYHSKQYLPGKVTSLIWGIGQPCLTTAFLLLFLVLRNALVMKSRFQNWYTTRNIALVTVPYYFFVLASEVIVSFIPTYRGLIFACQIINILLYVCLASFYSYISALIWKKLRAVRKGASQARDRGKHTFSILKYCTAAAIGGSGIAIAYLYNAVSVNSVLSNAKYVSPWPWFAFMTSLRCLELGMSLLLYMTGTQNTAGQQARRKVDVAPMTMMQTKVARDSEVEANKE